MPISSIGPHVSKTLGGGGGSFFSKMLRKVDLNIKNRSEH